jgi:hypothetical protein
MKHLRRIGVHKWLVHHQSITCQYSPTPNSLSQSIYNSLLSSKRSRPAPEVEFEKVDRPGHHSLKAKTRHVNSKSTRELELKLAIGASCHREFGGPPREDDDKGDEGIQYSSKVCLILGLRVGPLRSSLPAMFKGDNHVDRESSQSDCSILSRASSLTIQQLLHMT